MAGIASPPDEEERRKRAENGARGARQTGPTAIRTCPNCGVPDWKNLPCHMAGCDGQPEMKYAKSTLCAWLFDEPNGGRRTYGGP